MISDTGKITTNPEEICEILNTAFLNSSNKQNEINASPNKQIPLQNTENLL